MIKAIIASAVTALVVAFVVASGLVGGNQPAIGGDFRAINSDAQVRSIAYGGNTITTLTDADGGTYTLTEAELKNSTVLKFAAGGSGQAAIALTMPATSTMTTLLPLPGACRTWVYDATALSAATTTTITAGTGHDIIAYTTADDVIDGNEFAEIKMCRQADSATGVRGNVYTFTTEMLHAD